MARQEVPEPVMESKFWKPVIGSSIEGELLGTATHEYEGKATTNYVVLTPEGREQELPRHAHLEAKMGGVKVGNYVWITCIGEKSTRAGQNPMKVYKVEFDPDHKPKAKLNKDPDVGMGEPTQEQPSSAIDKALADLAKPPKQWNTDQVFAILGNYYPSMSDSLKAFDHLKTQGFICERKPGMWSVT